MKKTILCSVILLLILSAFAVVFVFPASEPQPAASNDVLHAQASDPTKKNTRTLAYIVSDTRIPFWDIIRRGIQNAAEENGYTVSVYSVENQPRKELEAVAKAISADVDGIIISPTSSTACATILDFANKAGIPVVIADIGTESGEYVSYIASDNHAGAQGIGRVLCQGLKERGWDDGTVGIVAIPQTRLNGQARTAGFMEPLKEAGIHVSGMYQQETWTEEETYRFTTELIRQDPRLRAIWLQGSNRYQGALRAIADAGKSGEILLVTFDAEPEFIEMIQQGTILGSAMQQPYRMGEEAVHGLIDHLAGKTVSKRISVPMLTIHKGNIEENRARIRKYVLGLEEVHHDE